MSTEGARSLLDDILPEYQSIVRAPTRADLIAEAKRRGVDEDFVFDEERRRRYKSLDTATGAVYLVANPATWIETPRGFVRPPPQLQFNLSEARRGGVTVKKVGSAAGAF